MKLGMSGDWHEGRREEFDRAELAASYGPARCELDQTAWPSAGGITPASPSPAWSLIYQPGSGAGRRGAKTQPRAVRVRSFQIE